MNNQSNVVLDYLDKKTPAESSVKGRDGHPELKQSIFIEAEECIKRILPLLGVRVDIDSSEGQERINRIIDELSIFTSDLMFRIPYHIISTEIYRISKEEEKAEGSIIEHMTQTIESVIEILDEKRRSDGKDICKKCLIALKFRDHLKLAEIQSSALSNNRQRLAAIGAQLAGAAKDTAAITDSLKNEVRNVHSQLISIVAIFTGIAFIMFGGVSALGGIKDAVQANGAAFFRVLSYACVIGVFTLGALLIFFKFILVILEKGSLGDRWFNLGKNIVISFLIIGFLLSLLAFNVDDKIGSSLFWMFNRLPRTQ